MAEKRTRRRMAFGDCRPRIRKRWWNSCSRSKKPVIERRQNGIARGGTMKSLACWIAVAALATAAYSQPPSSSRPVVYEGGRLIIGDGSAPIQSGTLVVQ